MDVDFVLKRNKELADVKSGWLPLLQDCADYVLPRKNNIMSDANRGGRRNTQVYDSTAVNSNKIFAAGMYNGLSDPTRPWFRTDIEDQDLKEFPPVKEYLQQVQRIYYLALARSNFYNEIHEAYLDMGAFGLPCLYMERDPDKMIRFNSRHISEINIALNNLGTVDTIFREFPFTHRQAWQAWKYDQKTAKEKPEKELKVLHAVFPRERYDPRKIDVANMPFESVYIDVNAKEQVSQSGYPEFPYMTAHWSKSSNETYARSPAMDVLPEILTVNQIKKTSIKAGHKRLDPPIFLPDDGFTGGKVRLTPGAVNVYHSRKGQGDIVIPNLGGESQGAITILQDSRETIREGFYVNLFLALLRKPNITATQTIKIDEEKMGLLSPMIGRIIGGLFNPMFDRMYGILSRDGYLPEPPEELIGLNLGIEFISPLALAREIVEAASIHRTYDFADRVSAHNPTVYDNLNDDYNLRRIAEINGMPYDGLNDQDQVDQTREARLQATEEEAGKADAAGMAGMMKDVAKAEHDARA